MSRLMKRLALVCLISLFAAPSLFATIWGPVGLPPLGTTRDVSFFTCASGVPSNTGYEEWDCLRHLHQVGSPANYAMVTDTNCDSGQEVAVTYYCKSSGGTWTQITQAQFNACESCN